MGRHCCNEGKVVRLLKGQILTKAFFLKTFISHEIGCNNVARDKIKIEMFNNPKSLFLFSSSSFYCTDIYFPLSLSTFISMATRASGVATSAQFTISLGYLVRKDLVLCISRFVVGISDLVCYCNICTV